MIRRLLFAAAFLSAITFSVQAQRVCVVDITQVLQSVPDYKRAQDELDKIATQWRQEIAQQQDGIKGLYNKYQAEQVLLSDEQKKQREAEIVNREKIVRDMQRDKFGPEGALFKKRQELVKPLQDKVYAVIERYATDKGYDVVLDKAQGVLFANAAVDRTNAILEMLRR